MTMGRRRQSAVYSPGGCGCGLLLLPVIAVSIGVMFALAGLAAAALVLLIVAIGVTIWLCRNREQRHADGKTNVGGGRLPDYCVPAECQLPGVLCPVDDQCLYRGIRNGGVGFDELLEDEARGRTLNEPRPASTSFIRCVAIRMRKRLAREHRRQQHGDAGRNRQPPCQPIAKARQRRA